MPRTILVLLAGLIISGSVSAAVTPILVKDGATVLSLDIPTTWKVWTDPANARIDIPEKHPHLEVVTIPGATSLDQADADLAKKIEGSVTHFKVAKTEALTIAGQPAQRSIGTGLEADDGDPSLAEVVAFTVNGSWYLLIAHGEGDGAEKRRADLTAVLNTAK